ncbi:MAG: hypothetical protein ACI4LX_04905 [Treponema sp.]
MIKKCCLNFLFLISVLFTSCNMQNVAESGASLKVALPPGNSAKTAVQYTADDIAQYEVVITNEYNKSFVKTGKPGETVSFERVLAGNYTVDVFALDVSGYTGARGSASATVKENETCNVAIPASLLYKSDFFISGADGVWLNNYADYFINSNYKSYRNDVDFSVTAETSDTAATSSSTSVRLTNGNIPYIYVNALNTKDNIIDLYAQKTSISFSAKASVPSTVNFYFQDTKHEPVGVVFQAELTTDFNEYEMSLPARTSAPDSGWSGTLRAVVTSGNGTVTIKNPSILYGDSDTACYTCYPPDTKGVKLSIIDSTVHTFEFTDTTAYGGLVGFDPASTKYEIVVDSTEDNVSITFYRYTLGGGIEELGSGVVSQTETATFAYETDPAVQTADDYEFSAVLFKVNKPMTISIQRYNIYRSNFEF